MIDRTTVVQNRVGTVADICHRIRAVLPTAWFPVQDEQDGSSTPVLDALLTGMAYAWQTIFSLLQFVRTQARLGTAGGSYLDIASLDYFGNQLPRQPGDTDTTFRTRLLANLLVEKATRSAVIATLLRVSGTAPVIQEPRQGAGLGGYGHGGYNISGFALGSQRMPFEIFVTCFPRGVYSARQSSATYTDIGGKLDLAPVYSLRQDYSGGGTGSILCESRGFNLIKDSLEWSGIDVPRGSHTFVTLGPDVSTPYTAAKTLSVSIEAAGDYDGPSVRVAVADQVLTGSVWIKIGGGDQFSSLYLRITDEMQGVSLIPVAPSATLAWQRYSVTHRRLNAGPGYVVMDVFGAAIGGGCELSTQCWQIEIGPAMSSYIPSRGTIGIREADAAMFVASQSTIPADRFTRDSTLVRTLPAGITAWIRDIP